MAYNAITGICFALLTLSVCYVVVSIIVKNRADRIKFIRGFKKGKCIAVFLISIPLLCIGYVYGGESVLDGILSAVSHVVDFVVLKFGVGKVSALMASSRFYEITVYYCCVVVILNAALFALSFIGQYLWQGINMLARQFTRKEKLFIFGNNENSRSVYKSGEKYHACIVDGVSPDEGFELYRKKIRYMSRDIGYGTFIDRILKSALYKNHIIVINFENDEKNLHMCNLILSKAEEMKSVPEKKFGELMSRELEAAKKAGKEPTEEELRAKETELRNKARKEALYEHLRVYVFGDPKYEALYGDIVEASYGCIRYKNKYRMIAMDFIDKYPLTKFMDERHIDYSTSFVYSDVNINVCMIGFGKPNRQIFLTSVANNQFLTQTENGVALKQVNYHTFDKFTAENDKNLNHLYYRYRSEFEKANADDYLPLPEMPAKDVSHRLDVNDPDFYKTLRAIAGTREKDVNFIIVSFESDLENIDMAQKLVEKRREWEARNLVIFVRVKKAHADHFVFREKNVFYIGNENECVYDVERIVSDKIFKMARMRNEIYYLENKITNDKSFVPSEASILENKVAADKKWFIGLTQLERESSLYSCLSLQSKLNLMGLEYLEKDGVDGMTEKEYMERYAALDPPDVATYNLNVEGKNVVKYTLDFPESKRKNLAVLEHYRWNSFMLSKGLVPASKERILNETAEKDGEEKHTNGKNYRLRRHGNITTFEGLTEFRKMLAKRDGGDEANYDVIKYDYQLLDDAYWLLDKNGYKIVERS